MKDNIQPLYLEPGADMPNNPALPVIIYRDALPLDTDDRAATFEAHFSANGWRGLWRNGIYGYHHFHPDAHEALGIARGRVRVRLGGEEGKTLELTAGDLVVLPAGTGHKRLDASEDLLVIGAYPAGQEDYDLCRSRNDCPHAGDAIAAVPLPGSDPLHGPGGPLLTLWRNGRPAHGAQASAHAP